MILKHTLNRKAFTMLELVFVIVIMGLLAKFGIGFLAQSYNNFIYSQINNKLQSNSTTAVEFISARLQNRIKPSTIAREDNGTFTPLNEYFGLNGNPPSANIIEWIGSDVEGFRGDIVPLWSGVLDLGLTNSTQLVSPTTNTGNLDTLIGALSNGSSGIDEAAIFFVNPDALTSSEVENKWGWNIVDTLVNRRAKFNRQEDVYIHPIKAHATNANIFLPTDGNVPSNDNNFSNVEAFEFYKLAWTAYAVGIDDYNVTDDKNTGNLTLWYDYQPWKGHKYNDNATNNIAGPGGVPHITKKRVIMQNVSSFQFIARESLIKIQVCVKSLLLETDEGDYSVCKEKTIF